jgi:hypothetical protein
VKDIKKTTKEKLLIRSCHSCLKVNESTTELERCTHCNKAFLPLRYFDKIHNSKEAKWENYFYPTELIEEDDLIKGLFVLW